MITYAKRLCCFRGSPYEVVAKVLDCDIVVSEFELQPHYYVHFRTNTLEKGMNLLILTVMGNIISLLFFYKYGFSIKLLTKLDMSFKQRK